MRSQLRMIAISCAACLFCGLAAAQSFPAVVIDVTAGDIYQVENKGEKQLVVLYGVVAPPSPAAARAARDAGIQKALGKQATVRVVANRPGMTLVELTLPDGTNLGHTLLRQGFLQRDSLTGASEQGLKDLEALAKQDRVGIWAAPTPTAEPAPAVPSEPARVMENERRFDSSSVRAYDIIEGRAYTDEKGVPTLVLRGNAQKIIGFESEMEQQRIDELTAAAEEAEWAAMDDAIAQAEAERVATEEQRLLDQAAVRDAQMQNLQMMNDYLLFGGNRGLRTTQVLQW